MDFLPILVGLLFLLVMVFLSKMNRENDDSVREIKPSADIACPSCQKGLSVNGMLDAAIFFDPSAVVFDCPHCKDRVYFAPFADRIDVGILGASPVLNPIPIESYVYPVESVHSFEIAGSTLRAQIGSSHWEIPSVQKWTEGNTHHPDF